MQFTHRSFYAYIILYYWFTTYNCNIFHILFRLSGCFPIPEEGCHRYHRRPEIPHRMNPGNPESLWNLWSLFYLYLHPELR